MSEAIFAHLYMNSILLQMKFMFSYLWITESSNYQAILNKKIQNKERPKWTITGDGDKIRMNIQNA